MSSQTPDRTHWSGMRPTAVLVRCSAILALAALVAGCETRGGKTPYAPEGFGPPDKRVEAGLPYDAPLGPLDIIKVNVFRVPELSGEYQIDLRGYVDMPLIGSVSARDLEAAQFAQRLEAIYGARYLNNPDINVRVENTNQLNVTVEGGVNAPGVYALTTRTSLLGVIAMAKGLNPSDSNPRRIIVYRKREGKTVAAAFDLISIRHGEMTDPLVYPGDTIIVDASKIRAIYRDLVSTLPTIAIFNGL